MTEPRPALPAWRLEIFESLPSTQALMRERLEGGQRVDGLVIRAAEQLAGRGRRENAWASQVGGSYQTLALQDRWDGALRTPAITLRLAVALAEGLRDAGARATVKWPNDIYLGEGKLLGILSEYLRGHLLVGVGVNVNNPVPPGAAALAGWELEYVNELVLRGARAAIADLLTGAHDLTERLEPLDHLRGRLVTVKTSRGVVTGVAEGADGDGAILVHADDGVIRVVDGTVLRWRSPAE